MVKHISSGGGAPIHTNSPIYSNVHGDGPPTTSNFPAHKATHMHKSPAGVSRDSLRQDIRSGPVNSGSQLPLKAGRHEAPGVNAPSGPAQAANRAVPRGTSHRNSFDGVGRIGGGIGGSARGDRGVKRTNWDGSTSYRGKSG